MAAAQPVKEYANLVLQLSNAVLAAISDPSVDLAAARATLKQRLFAAMPDAEYETMSLAAERALQEAVRENWSITQLDTALEAKYGVAEWQRQLFLRVWKKQQSKVRDTLSATVAFNSRLGSLDWRIDTKSKSKTAEELSELTAIVELAIAQPKRPKADAESGDVKHDVVRFELDREQLEQTLIQIRAIREVITAQTRAVPIKPEAAAAAAAAAAERATAAVFLLLCG
eukprot:a508397_98.p1 GENE.a508397_98~~a508397_98.p1  ORF type:complete len:243 (-),score=119.39 a508397_98:39-722(-)